MDHILVTGAAGFIGFHTCKALIEQGYRVTGLDNINEYYDTALKWARLKQLGSEQESAEKSWLSKSATNDQFQFARIDLVNADEILKLFETEKFDVVINLAAQAGVRYSLTNPQVYIDSNITGFLNILEACRSYPVKHLVYASTSSVYGLNRKIPFKSTDAVDHPISLYAASKRANELIAHSYSHLFNIPVTGLRFFSVYGPWGRPDMALFMFTKAILEGKPIDVYNNGKMKRDFTYVVDIVNGIVAVAKKPPLPNPEWDSADENPSAAAAPFKILNIGNETPVELLDFIREIEKNTGKKAIMNLMPMQPGDVEQNIADVSVLVNEYGYKPSTKVEEGVKSFVNWYLEFYHQD